MTNRALRYWVAGASALAVALCVLYINLSSDSRSAVRDLIPLVVAVLAAILAYQFQRRLVHIRRLDDWSARMNDYIESLNGLLEMYALPGESADKVSERAVLLHHRGRGILALGASVVGREALDLSVIHSALDALLQAAHYETGDLSSTPVETLVAEWPTILEGLWK